MKQFWQQLNIIRRWQLLTAIAIIIFIITYQLNFRKTFSVYSEYKSLSKTNDSLFLIIKTQENNASNQQNTETGNSVDITEKISTLCNNNQVDIIEMTQYSNTTHDSYTINTNKLILCGSYANTLKFVHQLEKDNNHGVNSFSCELSKDNLSGEYKLLTTIFIKSIIYEKQL